MIQTLLSQLRHPELWPSVLEVATINLMLSGDNVVAITLAARELPERQRRWGVTLGAGAAVVLTVLFASVVSLLMRIPYLKLLGGVALLYVAYSLATSRSPSAGVVVTPDGVWRAARAIAIATLVMSLDNVIAIAAAAHGNMAAIAIGLGLSIPVAVFGATLLGALLGRFPALLLAGGALLGWIAGSLIAEDPATTLVARLFGPVTAHEVDLAMAPAAALIVVLPHSGRWLTNRWDLTARLASWLGRPSFDGTPDFAGAGLSDPARNGDARPTQATPNVVAEPGEKTVMVSQAFEASRARVFEAWTTPQSIARWLALEGFVTSVCESDFKIGGKWRLVLQGPDGRIQALRGEYLDICAPERLVQAVRYDAAPHITAIETLNFQEAGPDKTILTSTTAHDTAENRDWCLASGATDGAARVIDRLTRYLDRDESNVSQSGR